MSTKYRTQFDIDREELEIIETALRDHARNLYLKSLDDPANPTSTGASANESVNSRMNEINSVLGKLHNQKIWYNPKEFVPGG